MFPFCFILLFGQVVLSGWRVFFEIESICLMCRGIVEIVIIVWFWYLYGFIWCFWLLWYDFMGVAIC